MNTQTGFAPVNKAQLYYEIAGEGQPMILLHAGVADCRMWDEQFAAFAAYYKVICYDLRGFGRSAATEGSYSHHKDLAGLLDFLQIEQALLMGVCYGAGIAVDFALTYPQQVAALVLGTPSIDGYPVTEPVRQFWQEEEAALKQNDLETAVSLNLSLWREQNDFSISSQ